MQVLEQRLRARGTDTEEVIARRLANAKKELEFAEAHPGFFDVVRRDTKCVFTSGPHWFRCVDAPLNLV